MSNVLTNDVCMHAANGGVKGSLTGISIGTVTPMQKVWRSLQAFGNIAFAYSYSIILIEIQASILISVLLCFLEPSVLLTWY